MYNTSMAIGTHTLDGMSQEHAGTRLLKMIQTRHPAYHPALAIADLAHAPEVENDLAFKCHATLLKYIEPELRSVQIQAEVKETRTIRVSLFEAIESHDSGKEAARISEAKTHAPKLPSVMDVEFSMQTEAVQGE